MRSFAPRSLGSIDITPINEAIAQTLSLSQHLDQPVILTYAWNYGEFSRKFSPEFNGEFRRDQSS